jgi:hypothetical protein
MENLTKEQQDALDVWCELTELNLQGLDYEEQ